MNALDLRTGLTHVVKMAQEDPKPQTAPAQTPKPLPALTKERALAFLTQDFPMTVVPMALGMTAGEGLVRAINHSVNKGGHPLPNAVRYGVPLGAATLSMLGMLAGHAHSKILAERAEKVQSP